MYPVFNLPMYVFNLPISKWSQLLHWNLLLIEITMRSKLPRRTAESLKLGHTMTFAWHFCFWACFCFPCCPEHLSLFSIVIQIQPVLQSSGQIPSWWIQISLILKPPMPYCLCHTICALSPAEFSIYKPLALHVSHVYLPWKHICSHAFYFPRSSQYLMQYHDTVRNQVFLLDAIICTWCHNLNV